MRARASTVVRPGRSGRSPQRATWPATHGRAPGADRLSQSRGSLGPASRIVARRIMLLHDVSTRTPAQVSSHRPRNRLCGDAPSPHAVTIRSPWPPAAATSAYAAGRPTATGSGSTCRWTPTVTLQRLARPSQQVQPSRGAKLSSSCFRGPRDRPRQTTVRRSFDLDCDDRAQHLNGEPQRWRNSPLT